MKAILVASVFNKEVVLISLILLKLHATTKASLVNKLPGRLDAEINNGFLLLTATVVGVRLFLPLRDLAKA